MIKSLDSVAARENFGCYWSRKVFMDRKGNLQPILRIFSKQNPNLQTIILLRFTHTDSLLTK